MVQRKQGGITVGVLWWHGEMRLKASGRNSWMRVVLWYDHCVPPPPRSDG